MEDYDEEDEMEGSPDKAKDKNNKSFEEDGKPSGELQKILAL